MNSKTRFVGTLFGMYRVCTTQMTYTVIISYDRSPTLDRTRMELTMYNDYFYSYLIFLPIDKMITL